MQTNGHPLDDQTRDEERARLEHLVNSPQEQSSHRKDYLDDQKHVALIMALLPEAYIFEYAGLEGGCHHLRFRPSPIIRRTRWKRAWCTRWPGTCGSMRG